MAKLRGERMNSADLAACSGAGEGVRISSASSGFAGVMSVSVFSVFLERDRGEGLVILLGLGPKERGFWERVEGVVVGLRRVGGIAVVDDGVFWKYIE